MMERVMDTVTEENRKDRLNKERMEKIDFKMVTFSLGGKDYGIDIMKVKEISKADRFTYVPNTAPFVKGVYNLRGEIISIIDLRIMFHLPAEKKKEGVPENIIILRLDEYLIGVVVDTIDKVVGISSETIQPAPSLFGDINIKYIKGVVNHEGRLYILLDVDRILGAEREEVRKEIETPLLKRVEEKTEAQDNHQAVDFSFIIDTLATFKKFTVNSINENWVRKRFDEWKSDRAYKGEDFQLKDPVEAEEYLSAFYSPYTGRFWAEEYCRSFEAFLPELTGGSFNVWNAGCGNGYETYSLAVLLKSRYPSSIIKIWAHDNDLLNISNAPNLLVNPEEVPEKYHSFLVEGKNGYQFSQVIKDSILFEYHDLLHQSSFPEVDFIVARDIVSFLNPGEQEKVFSEFMDKLKPGGLLFLGQNEILNLEGWEMVDRGTMKAYKKEV